VCNTTSSRVHDGRRRRVDTLRRVAPQLLQQILRRRFERRVFAARHGLGAVNYFHVRVNARALDRPAAFRVEEAERRRAQAPAVGELRRAGEANEAAPGRRAEYATKAALAEVVGEGVAARAGIAIDEHRLRA